MLREMIVELRPLFTRCGILVSVCLLVACSQLGCSLWWEISHPGQFQNSESEGTLNLLVGVDESWIQPVIILQE